jgi:RNA recognition motif-containing protein
MKTQEPEGHAGTDDEAAIAIESGRNLYVRNIAAATTSEEFCQLFETFGAVESHKVMVDIKSGLPRGFGFVLFEKEDDARAAAGGLNGFSLYGQPLSVRFASNAVRTPGEATGRLFLRHLPASFRPNDVRTLCLPDEINDVIVHAEGGDLAALAHVTATSPSTARRIARRLNNSTLFLHMEPSQPSSSPPCAEGAPVATAVPTIRNNIASAPRLGPGKAYRPLQVKVLSVGQDFPQPRQPPRAANAASQVSHGPAQAGVGALAPSHYHPSQSTPAANRDPPSVPLPFPPMPHPYLHAPTPMGAAQFLPAGLHAPAGWWTAATPMPPPPLLYPAPVGAIPLAQPWHLAFGFGTAAPPQWPANQMPLAPYVTPFPTYVYPFPNASPQFPSGSSFQPTVFTAPPPPRPQ